MKIIIISFSVMLLNLSASAQPPSSSVKGSVLRAQADNIKLLCDSIIANQQHGIDLWIDQLDIPPGKRWDVEVEKSLESAGSLLVILSETSVTSNNVLDEVSHALDNDKQIYPVLIDTCKIPFRLKRLQYIDFSTGYDIGLSLLLQAIKTFSGVNVKPPKTGNLTVTASSGNNEKAFDKIKSTSFEKKQGKIFQFLNKNGKLVIQVLAAIIACIIMYATAPVFKPRSLYQDQNFATYLKFTVAIVIGICIVICYFISHKKSIWPWWLIALVMLVAGIILNIYYNKYEGTMVIDTAEYGYGRLIKGDDYFPEVRNVRESYKRLNNIYPADLDLIAGFGGNHLKVWPKSEILSNSNSIFLLYSCMVLCFTLVMIFSIQAV